MTEEHLVDGSSTPSEHGVNPEYHSDTMPLQRYMLVVVLLCVLVFSWLEGLMNRWAAERGLTGADRATASVDGWVVGQTAGAMVGALLVMVIWNTLFVRAFAISKIRYTHALLICFLYLIMNWSMLR